MTGKTQGGWFVYLQSRDFRKTGIAIFLFFGICLLVSFLWLKVYTHHGQQLALPDYTGYRYEDALEDARRKKFRISVQDSLHVLGKPGGMILKQHPSAGSLVKAQRMIYVTITKRTPDKILSGRLPEMYGKNFERKKRELEEHFEIKSRIMDTRFDPGEPGQVLEVQYRGTTIIDARGRNNDVQVEKGDFLDFIVSGKSGGQVAIPNLICMTYEEVEFYLENLGLSIGDITRQNGIVQIQAAYIVSQQPAADGSVMDLGSSLHITVTSDKPDICD